MFTTNTFFSYGSADKNDFYPRYLHNLTAPFHLNSHILKNFACDDHFFMLSRKPEGSTFSYGIREDTITFAWDCKHKYIFTEGGATKRGEYCGKTGFYSVTVGIDAAGYAVFRDDICGEMKFKLEDPTGPWYLFIGGCHIARPSHSIEECSTILLGTSHHTHTHCYCFICSHYCDMRADMFFLSHAINQGATTTMLMSVATMISIRTRWCQKG